MIVNIFLEITVACVVANLAISNTVIRAYRSTRRLHREIYGPSPVPRPTPAPRSVHSPIDIGEDWVKIVGPGKEQR